MFCSSCGVGSKLQGAARMPVAGTSIPTLQTMTRGTTATTPCTCDEHSSIWPWLDQFDPLLILLVAFAVGVFFARNNNG